MIPTIILTIENNDDREFMTQLYLDNQYIMYSEIYKLVQDPWVAEDILQDSLVRLIDKIPTLKTLNTRRQVNYVITTVRNQAKNHFRKQSKIDCSSLDDEDSFLFASIACDSNLEETVFLRDDIGHLREIWPQLSEVSQQILERKYFLCQSDAEIAEALSVKPSSIRMKLSRARKEALSLL